MSENYNREEWFCICGDLNLDHEFRADGKYHCLKCNHCLEMVRCEE